MSASDAGAIRARQTAPEDFTDIINLTREVYPGARPWSEQQLTTHLSVFPEGQRVAVDNRTGEIVGMAASLIVFWDDYNFTSSWRDFTASGMFTNHDPALGRTLYGAEVMVKPSRQGQGVGKVLYESRREIAKEFGLTRIRAGARLRNYGSHADMLSSEEYVRRVVAGELYDTTLTFQLRRGFHVLAVVRGYLRDDPESLGYAAVIEWLNPDMATAEDFRKARIFG